MLQRNISAGAAQIENDDLMERYLCAGTHEIITSGKMFKVVQGEKQKQSNIWENKFAIGMIF